MSKLQINKEDYQKIKQSIIDNFNEENELNEEIIKSIVNRIITIKKEDTIIP